MANPEHLAILKQGVKAWNAWREHGSPSRPDLSDADLRSVGSLEGANLRAVTLKGANLAEMNLAEADLCDADLSGANLSEAVLSFASLRQANLSAANLSEALMFEADLSDANLHRAFMPGAYLVEARLPRADLSEADLTDSYLVDAVLPGANLSMASLSAADLIGADLSGASLSMVDMHSTNLSGANLSQADLTNSSLDLATLVETTLTGATLNGCTIYGISAWNLQLDGANQADLVISPADEPDITVDNLEVAQFVYLLLHNPKIRDVINTIGNKSVLVLGRFSERKHVLEAIREAVRAQGLLPMVFDFERPEQRDFSETVLTLAGISRFIIADITRPKSVPLELELTVPNYMIPFVPIIQAPDRPFAMFQDLWKKYGDWVLEPLRYDSVEQLVGVFENAVIEPANERRALLQAKKAQRLVTRHAKDYE